jgi:hypothetical protein
LYLQRRDSDTDGLPHNLGVSLFGAGD